MLASVEQGAVLADPPVKLQIVRNPSEILLASIYLRLWSDNQLGYFWHSGNISTVSEFLASCKAPDTVVYVGLWGERDGDHMDVAGLGFAQQCRRVGIVKDEPAFIAEVSMAFTRQVQAKGGDLTRELAELMIEDGFQNCGFVALFGTTPVKNPAAIRFIDKMGFERIGVAPSFANWHGEPCDCVLSVMTKAKWFSSERR
jgi:hypothetical protein